MKTVAVGMKNKVIKASETQDSFPKTSQHTQHLGEVQVKVVYAILEKDLSESWESVAVKLGVSRRQLFNLRQERSIQTAVYHVTKEMLKADLPDILKALTARAKKGDTAAIRLYLELCGELSRGQVEQPGLGDRIENEFYSKLYEVTGRPMPR